MFIQHLRSIKKTFKKIKKLTKKYEKKSNQTKKNIYLASPLKKLKLILAFGFSLAFSACRFLKLGVNNFCYHFTRKTTNLKAQRDKLATKEDLAAGLGKPDSLRIVLFWYKKFLASYYSALECNQLLVYIEFLL